ncbi:hypothetical protein [Nitrosovibrio sp. Nv4]|uniref:hypothetical protein n=1 Tax=Nitrosovibrio sp. Nv4 TaxID=1945880 RepID=UPI000BD960FF|nr:hypothetical protein [Nitrosovibrio sp. Nv4]SOD42418.1 hypothetical protein SAMN06298226_2757 [Nitrosovibrio sp. Nv4]
MATRVFHMNGIDDEERLREFLRDIHPRGLSIVSDGDAEVWLLKPTIKGGRTIGRIIVKDDSFSDLVMDTWRQVMKEISEADKRRAAEMDEAQP